MWTPAGASASELSSFDTVSYSNNHHLSAVTVSVQTPVIVVHRACSHNMCTQCTPATYPATPNTTLNNINYGARHHHSPPIPSLFNPYVKQPQRRAMPIPRFRCYVPNIRSDVPGWKASIQKRLQRKWGMDKTKGPAKKPGAKFNHRNPNRAAPPAAARLRGGLRSATASPPLSPTPTPSSDRLVAFPARSPTAAADSAPAPVAPASAASNRPQTFYVPRTPSRAHSAEITRAAYDALATSRGFRPRLAPTLRHILAPFGTIPITRRTAPLPARVTVLRGNAELPAVVSPAAHDAPPTAPAAAAAHDVARTPAAVVSDTLPPPAAAQSAPLPPPSATPVRALSPVDEAAVHNAEEDYRMDVDGQMEQEHLMDVEAEEERTIVQPPATVEPASEPEPELTFVPSIPSTHFGTTESTDAPDFAPSSPSTAYEEGEIDELTDEIVPDPRTEPVPEYRHRPKAAKRKRSRHENVAPDQHPAKRHAVAAPAPAPQTLAVDQPAVTQPPPPLAAPPARAWPCIFISRDKDLSKAVPKARQCAVRESAQFIKRAPATSTFNARQPQGQPQHAKNNHRAPPDSSNLSSRILDEWRDGLAGLLAYLHVLEDGKGGGRHPQQQQLKTWRAALRDAREAVDDMESNKGNPSVEAFMHVKWPRIRKECVRFVDRDGSWAKGTDTDFADNARSILRRAIAVIGFFEERVRAARAGTRTKTRARA